MNFTTFNFKTVLDCSARVACRHGAGKRAYLNPAAPLCFFARYQFMFSENEGMINSAAAFISALPGGYRNNNGNFNNLGNNANFGSSTENNTNNAWNRNLNYNNSDVNRNNNNKQNGFSIRLIRDLKQSKGHGGLGRAAMQIKCRQHCLTNKMKRNCC